MCRILFYFILFHIMLFVVFYFTYLFIFIFDFLLGLRPKPIEPSNAFWAFSSLAQTRSTSNRPRLLLKHPNDGPSPRLAFPLQLVRALPLIRLHTPTPSRAPTWFSFCFMQSLRYLSTSRSASCIPHYLLPSHLHFFLFFSSHFPSS